MHKCQLFEQSIIINFQNNHLNSSCFFKKSHSKKNDSLTNQASSRPMNRF